MHCWRLIWPPVVVVVSTLSIINKLTFSRRIRPRDRQVKSLFSRSGKRHVLVVDLLSITRRSEWNPNFNASEAGGLKPFSACHAATRSDWCWLFTWAYTCGHVTGFSFDACNTRSPRLPSLCGCGWDNQISGRIHFATCSNESFQTAVFVTFHYTWAIVTIRNRHYHTARGTIFLFTEIKQRASFLKMGDHYER